MAVKSFSRILQVKYTKSRPEAQGFSRFRPGYGSILGLGGPLAVQIDVQLVLDLLRYLPLHGAADGVGHAAREACDELRIHHHLLRRDDGGCIIPLVDGAGRGRRDPCEGQAGHALVRKGSGIAGIDAGAGGDGKAQLVRRVFQEGDQPLLRGAAGDELAHDAADHVQIDVQDHLLQLRLMFGAIVLGAQQTQLLPAAPDEAQAPPMGPLHEPLRHAQDADGAGHVVIAAAGQGRGIVMSREHDPLVDLAGQLPDEIVGVGLENILLYLDAGAF